MKQVLILALGLILSMGAIAQKGYKVGDVAKGFELKGLDGKMMSLESMTEAKGYIVIFTCNHCPYSVAYEDRIIALDKKYKKLGYPVIAVNPNDTTIVPEDSWTKMKERAAEKGFTFPYLIDEDQTVYKRFGATRTPHVFVLNRGHEGMTVEYIGAIDDNYGDPDKVKKKYLEDAVDALLEGDKPIENFTKAIGCTIKAKKK